MSALDHSLLSRWSDGAGLEEQGRYSHRAESAGMLLCASDLAAKHLAAAINKANRQTQAAPGAGIFSAKELAPV